MNVYKKHFTSILDDNTEAYFRHLEGVVSSVDYNASIEVTNKISGINVRIAPSEYEFLSTLIKDIERLHNNLGLKMLYSKSMKSSGNINFDIVFMRDLVV